MKIVRSIPRQTRTTTPQDALVQLLKSAGIWQACVMLKVFGKSSTERGYEFNFTSGSFTNVRSGMFRPENAFTDTVQLPQSLSSCSVFCAVTGGSLPEIGTTRTLINISSTSTLPSTNTVRIFKAASGSASGQLAGGGSQSFYDITTNAWDGTTARTYLLSLNVPAKTATTGLNGVLGSPTAYTHGDPAGLQWVSGGNMRGTYSVFAVFNRVLTATEYAALDAAVRDTVMGSRTNIVFEGDSIINFLVSGQGMRDRFLLGAASNWAGETWHDISTGGNTTSDILSQWPSQINPFIANGGIDRSIVVVWAGQNDFSQNTAAQRPTSTIHANLRTIWAQAKARGFRVVAVVPYYNPARLEDRPVLRDLIRADEGVLYDVCIDMHEAFNAAVGGSYWLNTTFFPDGVHPGVPAMEVMANAFNAVSERVFAR